jgi:hypothetical protein
MMSSSALSSTWTLVSSSASFNWSPDAKLAQPLLEYPSIVASVELYLMSPFAGDPGLCAVVPDANLTASVAATCKVVAGEAVPTPTLLLLTSKANKFVSNVRSVPDLAKLADSICPVILPIAILFSPYRDNLVLKL